MANNCGNSILFQGDKVSECMEFVKSRIREDGNGIFLVDGEYDRYCFEIDADSERLNFITKWGPDILQIHALALKFGLQYEYYYEELGCEVYGCAIFDGDFISIYDLEESHFQEIEENEEEGTYRFRGEEYESQYDILDILLEEEIKKV